MIARRAFLTGLASAFAAPAIVRAGSLMPVKRMVEIDPVGFRYITSYAASYQEIGDLDVLFAYYPRPEWALTA